MEYYVSDDKRERLRTAFHKVAMAKSLNLEAKVLETTTKLAFVRELAEIDTELDFEKNADFMDFVKKWGPDIALTALMFVPGVNVIAGGARLAYGAARLGMAGHKAYKAYKGAKMLHGLSKVNRLKTYGQGLIKGQRGVTQSLKAKGAIKPGYMKGMGEAGKKNLLAARRQGRAAQTHISKGWSNPGGSTWRGTKGMHGGGPLGGHLGGAGMGVAFGGVGAAKNLIQGRPGGYQAQSYQPYGDKSNAQILASGAAKNQRA